ncbi:MAG: hypothetical protein H6750_13695 [Nitrospiraceae bacterium]|nr:hypothetical protein [Nitrospira sp.]MCB9775359.1 hypothetical protein [Nitrospiraceae bacterium]
MRNIIMNIPIPTALVGVGLYWLCKNSSQGSLTSLRSEGSESSPWCKQENGHTPIKEQVKEQLEKATDTVEGQLTEWKVQARQQAYEWKKGTEQKMDNVKAYIAEKRMVARGEFSRLLDAHPLAVGAGMVALGVAVAAAIPVSRKEDVWVGPSREKMVESVKTAVGATAEDVTQKAGQVVKKALQNKEYPPS